MPAEQLSKKAAEKIANWVAEHDGKIVRMPGAKTNVQIAGIPIVTTIVLARWLEQGAQAYLDRGFINISNWPEKEIETVFEIRIKGRIMALELEANLKGIYAGASVKHISTRESP